MATYSWRNKRGGNGVAAQMFGERIDSIRARTQRPLQKQDVVDDARPADSPLHPMFEWDDSVAGERWRETQACQYLRDIVVVIEASDSPTQALIRARAFISIDGDEDEAGSQRSYVAMTDALADPLLMRQVYLRALKDVEELRMRYAEHRDLAELFREAVAAIADRADQLKGRRVAS